MKNFVEAQRELIKMYAGVPGVIKVMSRKKQGGVLVGPSFVQNFGSGYACLNAALDYVSGRAANPRVRRIVTGITVAGVPLSAEQIAAYPLLLNVRTGEQLAARAGYSKELYAELQAQTPAGIAAKARQQKDEYKAFLTPAKFGL